MAERFVTYMTEDAEAGNIPIDGNGVMQPRYISKLGDTLTWDGNTEGRAVVAVIGGLNLYHVSSLVPTRDDVTDKMITVRTVTGVHLSAEIQSDEMMTGILVFMASESAYVFVVEQKSVGVNVGDDDDVKVVFPKKGVYFSQDVRGITIPGYTNFVAKTLNPAWGVSKAEAVADAAGSAPTAEEFNALLTSLRNAGYLKV